LYAIGDVHGDAERLIKVMSAHGLVDVTAGNVRWTRPNVVVILMGDITDAKSRLDDRGDSAFQGSLSDLWIVEFVKLAASEATKVGSELFVLLGNHELMNYRGDFRYASPHHVRDPASRRAYFREGGSGYDALTSIFVTSITYNRNNYSHAGIPLGANAMQTKMVDKRVNGALLATDERTKDLEEFVSHRDYFESDRTGTITARLGPVLARHAIDRMVVGHNYTHGEGIVSDYGGQVVFTDVGLSKAFAPTVSVSCTQIAYDPGDGHLCALNMDGSTRPIAERSDPR
jgi:cleavage and polyadenylation specificity factor subunit 3